MTNPKPPSEMSIVVPPGVMTPGVQILQCLGNITPSNITRDNIAEMTLGILAEAIFVKSGARKDLRTALECVRFLDEQRKEHREVKLKAPDVIAAARARAKVLEG